MYTYINLGFDKLVLSGPYVCLFAQLCTLNLMNLCTEMIIHEVVPNQISPEFSVITRIYRAKDFLYIFCTSIKFSPHNIKCD